jgi:hypothetical protein
LSNCRQIGPGMDGRRRRIGWWKSPQCS